MEPRMRNARIPLFLDFDGTLAPIVEDPERASIPARMRKILADLSGLPSVRLAVVSGRTLADVKKRTGIRGIAYAGNHGLELEGPGFRYRPRIPLSYPKIRAALRKALEHGARSISGVRIEDKGLTMTFHFRRVKAGAVPKARALFRKTLGPSLERGDVAVRSGKKVWEIRPPVDWDKGRAVLWLLRCRKWTPASTRTVPVYVGDDRTDEDAFRALRRRGLTVRVGRSTRTSAEFFLRNVDEVAAFLEALYEMKRNGR